MNWRIVLAFLVSPALCPLAAQLIDALTLKPEHLDANALYNTLVLYVYYAMAFLAGIPLHEHLHRKGWKELLHYMLAGALLGIVPAIAASMSAAWVPSSAALSPVLNIGVYSRAAKA